MYIYIYYRKLPLKDSVYFLFRFMKYMKLMLQAKITESAHLEDVHFSFVFSRK